MQLRAAHLSRQRPLSVAGAFVGGSGAALPRRSCRLNASHPQQPHATPAVQQAAAVAAAAALCLLGSPPAACWAAPPAASPYEEAKRLVYGLDRDGSIRSCPSNVNPNCVSTRSTNATFSPVWRAPDAASPAAAAAVLEDAAARVLGPEAALVQSQTLSSGSEYRAWSVPSLFGRDIVEVLVKFDDGGGGGGGEAPPARDVLVTYRSMAGSVKYVWPIQQPVSDFGAQQKRLDALREAAGFRVFGCDLLECYY